MKDGPPALQSAAAITKNPPQKLPPTPRKAIVPTCTPVSVLGAAMNQSRMSLSIEVELMV